MTHQLIYGEDQCLNSSSTERERGKEKRTHWLTNSRASYSSSDTHWPIILSIEVLIPSFIEEGDLQKVLITITISSIENEPPSLAHQIFSRGRRTHLLTSLWGKLIGSPAHLWRGLLAHQFVYRASKTHSVSISSTERGRLTGPSARQWREEDSLTHQLLCRARETNWLTCPAIEREKERHTVHQLL